MFFVSESEPVSVPVAFQRCRVTDEYHGVVGVVFLAEFGRDRLSGNHVSCRSMRRSGCSVRFRIDSNVQPALLGIESVPGFVDREVVRDSTAVGLDIGPVYPGVNGETCVSGTENSSH